MILHNRKIKFERNLFEVFWVTGYAYHIERRYTDTSHRINILQVEELATQAIFIPYKKELYAGLGRFDGKFYKILAYFSKGNKRCVIKTCNIVNETYLIKKCQELL